VPVNQRWLDEALLRRQGPALQGPRALRLSESRDHRLFAIRALPGAGAVLGHRVASARSRPRKTGPMRTADPHTSDVSHGRHVVPSAPTRRDPRRRSRVRAPTLLGISIVLAAGCARTNHHLIHPSEPAPEVVVWSGDFARDDLKVHIEGARPPGVGPFPTILV